MPEPANDRFQIHLSTAIILFLIATALVGVDVSIYSTAHPSIETLTSPANLVGILIILGVESVMLIYPYLVLESRIRRQNEGRTLKLRMRTYAILAVGAISAAAIKFFNSGFPFGLYGRSAELSFTALGLNVFVAVVLLTGIAVAAES